MTWGWKIKGRSDSSMDIEGSEKKKEMDEMKNEGRRETDTDR